MLLGSFLATAASGRHLGRQRQPDHQGRHRPRRRTSGQRINRRFDQSPKAVPDVARAAVNALPTGAHAKVARNLGKGQVIYGVAWPTSEVRSRSQPRSQMARVSSRDTRGCRVRSSARSDSHSLATTWCARSIVEPAVTHHPGKNICPTGWTARSCRRPTPHRPRSKGPRWNRHLRSDGPSIRQVLVEDERPRRIRWPRLKHHLPAAPGTTGRRRPNTGPVSEGGSGQSRARPRPPRRVPRLGRFSDFPGLLEHPLQDRRGHQPRVLQLGHMSDVVHDLEAPRVELLGSGVGLTDGHQPVGGG